ncbi:unnamed protein product [Meloidogyne enterolobii]|uniref:Uncharacterized protein n=1 Tax=Meloidogyne enterolobii TaxID=390850 RepID=A0ACB0XZ25_MELEN
MKLISILIIIILNAILWNLIDSVKNNKDKNKLTHVEETSKDLANDTMFNDRVESSADPQIQKYKEVLKIKSKITKETTIGIEEKKLKKNENMKSNWENKKEKKRERDRKYYQKNKEKKRERDRKYRQNNKEKRREIDRKYYQNNKEKKREWDRKTVKKGKIKRQIYKVFILIMGKLLLLIHRMSILEIKVNCQSFTKIAFSMTKKIFLIKRKDNVTKTKL